VTVSEETVWQQWLPTALLTAPTSTWVLIRRIKVLYVVPRWLVDRILKCMWLIFRLRCLHAVHRCGLLLQMSHIVCLSVCACVCRTHGWAVQNGRTDRDAVWLADWRGSKEPCIRWVQIHPGKGHFWGEGTWQSMVMYLCSVNIPVQYTQWLNAFATARSDKMAVQSLAELLWIHCIVWQIAYCHCKACQYCYVVLLTVRHFEF